ncbi:hypothetical protein F5051DRAFT_432234 [Lentinula edodes]|nr:hypothetical protein F5051DRAFT_432234 [Lentinula edodes]
MFVQPPHSPLNVLSIASTPPPGSIISRAVSLTQTIPSNTDTSTSTTDPSTGTGTITFLGTHSGVPLLPHESPKISTAYEKGDIPRDVYTRVRQAVREVVPGWDAEERSGSGRGGKGVLAFSNSFEETAGGAGAGARGRVVQYGVIEEWEGGAGFTCSSQLISSLPSNLLLPTIQKWGKKEKTQVNHAQKSGVVHSRLVTTAGVEPAIS